VPQRHCLEQAERGANPLVDRGGPVVVKDELYQWFIVESGRRDRGVCVRSEMTLIQSRDEGGEQLALADRPLRRSAHHGLGVNALRLSEQVLSVTHRSDDIRYSEPGRHPYYRIEQSR
jgi:hypothetical protein